MTGWMQSEYDDGNERGWITECLCDAFADSNTGALQSIPRDDCDPLFPNYWAGPVQRGRIKDS